MASSPMEETHGGYAALDQTNTIARWMHDAGYRTAHIGKYMNGYNAKRVRPGRMGRVVRDL